MKMKKAIETVFIEPSIELVEKRKYIIRERSGTYLVIMKIEVIEKTFTSIRFKNLDSENPTPVRSFLKDFISKWEILEVLD